MILNTTPQPNNLLIDKLLQVFPSVFYEAFFINTVVVSEGQLQLQCFARQRRYDDLFNGITIMITNINFIELTSQVLSEKDYQLFAKIITNSLCCLVPTRCATNQNPGTFFERSTLSTWTRVGWSVNIRVQLPLLGFQQISSDYTTVRSFTSTATTEFQPESRTEVHL